MASNAIPSRPHTLKRTAAFRARPVSRDTCTHKYVHVKDWSPSLGKHIYCRRCGAILWEE